VSPAEVDVREIEPLTAPPDAVVRVPGSRSITNRALVCAALADGTSTLTGVLDSDDTQAMLGCLTSLGIAWRDLGDDTVEVDGCGGAVPPGPASVFTRLSGTTSRFVTAMCALGHGDYLVDAEEPMRARPMGDLVDALRKVGATIDDTDGRLPLTVHADGIHGADHTMRGDVSSQFLSAVLLIAPCSAGELRLAIDGPLKSVPYVEMTKTVMAAFGAEVGAFGIHAPTVVPGGYAATTYTIEPDASTACYFWAAAAISGGTVRVRGLSGDSIQGDVAFVGVLERMGCVVDRADDSIAVTGPERLTAVDVDLSDISDQAPTFAVVAAFAEGTSRATGIGFIRRKESDRIAAVVEGLGRLGVDAAEVDDGFAVVGTGPGEPHGGRIRTFDDHRIAMSFALPGLRIPRVVIEDPGCVAKTFPGFFDALDRLGVPA
jgi:3-phosphoshikimate 1-carboxyvinyltransferase